MRILALFPLFLVAHGQTHKVTDEYNKELKSNCGEIFNIYNKTHVFPQWLLPVEFRQPTDEVKPPAQRLINTITGVVISKWHVLVPAKALFKGYPCNATTKDAWRIMMKKLFVDSFWLSTKGCWYYNGFCKFVHINSMSSPGACKNGEFFGIFVLHRLEPLEAPPICLPRTVFDAEEYNFPDNEAKYFLKQFPNETNHGDNGSSQYSPRTGKFVKHNNTFVSEDSVGGIVVNEFEGRTYFIGFDSDKAPETKGDSATYPPMQEFYMLHSKEICDDTGVCPIDNFKPESLLPPTTTPEPTTTTEPTTPEPTDPPTEPPTQEPTPEPTTTKRKRPRFTRKPMLPFEYEDSDYMYYPEHTTKTANKMGTFWATVFVVLSLGMCLFS